MLTPIYKIKNLCGDRFSIMPHPQGGEDLENEVLNFKRQSVEIVISMLTLEEQTELKLLEEREICEKHGLLYFNFPIRDEVADSDEDVINFIDKLEQLLTIKNYFLFHCRGGVGRSSMMLSLIADRLGVCPETSFDLISKSRGEQAPESEFQKKWVVSLSKQSKPIHHFTSTPVEPKYNSRSY